MVETWLPDAIGIYGVKTQLIENDFSQEGLRSMSMFGVP